MHQWVWFCIFAIVLRPFSCRLSLNHLQLRGGSTFRENNQSFHLTDASFKQRPKEHHRPALNISSKFIRFLSMYDLLHGFLSNFITDQEVLRLSMEVLFPFVWFLIILSGIGTLGIDTKPIVSLLGVAGITLGFSLKDLLADIYLGIFVIFTKPFQQGSIISVDDFEGKVISMDFRYVRLHSEVTNCEILLPLSIVYKNAIVVKASVSNNERKY